MKVQVIRSSDCHLLSSEKCFKELSNLLIKLTMITTCLSFSKSISLLQHREAIWCHSYIQLFSEQMCFLSYLAWSWNCRDSITYITMIWQSYPSPCHPPFRDSPPWPITALCFLIVTLYKPLQRNCGLKAICHPTIVKKF